MTGKEGQIPPAQIVPDMPLASFSRTPTQQRINLYAKMSTDYNPIHVDANYAKQTPFGGTIAHGMLVLSYISEMMILAFGSQWLSTGWLSIRFKSPALSGKKVKVEGRVHTIKRIDKKTKVICAVACRDETGNPIIIGEAGVTMDLTNN
jgi:3-hydroxybutyryl-CoA dehydratase